MAHKIILLVSCMRRTTAYIQFKPGDGVGPEVVLEAKKVLEVVNPTFVFEEHLIGGCAIDATDDPLPPKTLEACRSASAVLLGAVGGPQWPKPSARRNGALGPRPEEGLLAIRKELNLFANIRPCVFPSKSLMAMSPLKEDRVKDVEFIIVRELTGGVYFGERHEEDEKAWDKMSYSVSEVERITRVAAQLAMLSNPPQTITSIDKANVLATSRLWRRVVTDTLKREFPTIPLRHNLVDSAAMLMVRDPRALNGVVLTENMFGDILSDEASVIPGSLGLLPSASLSGLEKGSIGLYEPIHGSAPDIAGQGIANPIGTILSAALLLRYSFGMEAEAKAIETAVQVVLDDASIGGRGLRTRDLGGTASTTEVGDAVVEELKKVLKK
ncbi:3-isopropylmalate dehydrogenase [Phlyctochytrium bullatum]|nr:3-isopropylmalate dehydrogenase [Phlyctochytrium bullatum]